MTPRGVGRHLFVAVVGVGLAAGLAGCGGSPASPGPGAGGGTEVVTVYFNREHLGEADAACGLVAPVEREIPAISGPAVADRARTALEELLEGPTETERAQGYYSWFSAATSGSLRSVRLADDAFLVDLRDLREVIPGASSSCGREDFLGQIEATLGQLEPGRPVVLAIEGNPRILYDWLEISCDAPDDRCEPGGFRD